VPSTTSSGLREARNRIAREFRHDLVRMDEVEYSQRRDEWAEFHSHGPDADIARIARQVGYYEALEEFSNLPIAIRTGEEQSDVEAAKRKLLNMFEQRDITVDKRAKQDPVSYYQMQSDPEGPISHHKDHGDYVDPSTADD
jgi:hypothetical protein